MNLNRMVLLVALISFSASADARFRATVSRPMFCDWVPYGWIAVIPACAIERRPQSPGVVAQ